jgi:hypothetical protein
VSSRGCPDWPQLMEIAPNLHFRHCTLGEVQLPAGAFVRIAGITLDTVAICCDLESHVYYAEHTAPQVVAALRGTHWIDLREWSAGAVSPGASRP